METYEEFQAKIAELQAQADEIFKKEQHEALGKIKKLMGMYKISIEDIQGTAKKSRKVSEAKAKYRDPITGSEWSGRGRAPRWLEGKNRDDFRV